MNIYPQGNLQLRDTSMPLLSSVFNAVNFCIVVIDHYGCFSEVNDAYCRMMGYTRDELVGQHFLTIVPQEQRKSFMQSFNEMINSTGQFQFEGEYVSQRKDGHIFEVYAHTCLVERPDGTRCLIVSLTDLTEINKYKKLLEETELATGVGGWQMDMQTNRFYCTEGMYKLFDIPGTTNITWNDMFTFFEDDCDAFRRALKLAVENGKPFNIELNCSTTPGTKKWIRAMGRPERILNKTTRLFGTFQDITQHKMAEDVIFLGQEKYRAIANSSLYAFILGTPDGGILEVNKKATELFGYTEEEFKKLGRYGCILHTPELAALLDERRQKGYTQGELIAIKKNGEHIPCEFSSVCFTDLNGEERMSTIMRDISGKKKSERELKKLSHIARETISAIVITDIDTKIQWVNAAFTRITGYTLQEVKDKKPEDFLYGEETDPNVIADIVENKKASRTFDTELLIYTKSGNKVWVTLQAQPQFDDSGHLSGYFAMGIDITEQKNSQAEIIRNQKLLQQAERIALLGSWETDLKTGKSIWSDELFRIYGLEPSTVAPDLGKLVSLIHPDDRERVLNALHATFNGKGSFDLESRIVQPNGNIRIIHAQGQLVKNLLGEIEKFIGVLHDITSQKEAEDRLRQEESERIRLEKQLLEEKVNRQKQIARATINTQEKERSEIGKELHDNVNQILASAKLFLSSPFIEGSEREKFTNKAIDHINMAIEEMRKLSKSLVSPSAADLGIIDTINDLVYDIKMAQKIDARFDDGGIDESTLDNGVKLTMYRIIQEQVTNILKYAEATVVRIAIKEEDKRLVLTITDNGKGFDFASKRRGIGLNNIINRADVFNGKVDIQTAPGMGCTVKVVFDK